MIINHQPDQSFIRFGADSLLTQLQAMTKEIEGVRAANDLEFVHRMRVASRRLRTRLRLFANVLPHKKAAAWTQEVRRVTRALGAARDADVQIAFLEEFAAGLTDARHRPGIARLLFRFRQRRERLQKKVGRALDQLEASRLVLEMERTLRQLRIATRSHLDDRPSPFSYQQAFDALSTCYAEMESYEIYVRQPERREELHQMRIAAKHFRYTLEAFAAWYPDELKEYLKAIREVQELLGDLHDADVWIECLPRFLEKERDRAQEYSGSTRAVTRLQAGLRHLEKDRGQAREESYRLFAACWEETQARGLWKELLEILSAPLEAAPPPAEPEPPLAEENTP